MKIELKQPEIIVALKQYIMSKGIDLCGKQVTISFTAGRKESGVSAELNIEEPAPADFEKFYVPSVIATIPVAAVIETPEEASTQLTEETPKTVSLFA